MTNLVKKPLMSWLCRASSQLLMCTLVCFCCCVRSCLVQCAHIFFHLQTTEDDVTKSYSTKTCFALQLISHASDRHITADNAPWLTYTMLPNDDDLCLSAQFPCHRWSTMPSWTTQCCMQVFSPHNGRLLIMNIWWFNTIFPKQPHSSSLPMTITSHFMTAVHAPPDSVTMQHFFSSQARTSRPIW